MHWQSDTYVIEFTDEDEGVESAYRQCWYSDEHEYNHLTYYPEFATKYDSFDSAQSALESLDPEGYPIFASGHITAYDPRYRTVNGGEITFVNVYLVDRQYGGREEGGWWFDTGEPVYSVPCRSEREIEEAKHILAIHFPNTGKSSSVLGGEDYRIITESHPGKAYPETYPHYE